MNWYVMAPPKRTNSAGVEVLHKLIDKLNEAGEFATDKYSQVAGKVDVIVLPDIEQQLPRNFEISATRVRYCLFYPGGHGVGPVAYTESIQFTFAEHFLPGKPVFRLSTINREIFRNLALTNRAFDRPAISVYLGKGDAAKYAAFIADHPAAFRITRTEPTDQKNLAMMLNCSSVLYTFDTDTRLIEEAIECGCHVMGYSSTSHGGGKWEPLTPPSVEDTPISVMIDAVKAERENANA